MSERQAARIKKLESQLRKERTKVKKLEKEWNSTVQTSAEFTHDTRFGRTCPPNCDVCAKRSSAFEEYWNRSLLSPEQVRQWLLPEVSRTKPFTPLSLTATTEEDDDDPLH